MSDQPVRDAFRDQARSCAALGSPFTAALCASLARILDADHGRVAARVLGWAGDPTSRADSVPLRLCGALHALVLTGADPALAATYRARVVDQTAVLAALLTHEDTVLDWLDSPPQTNEVARSAAIIAAARFLKTFCRLPIRALELGASAGLNLNFGLYHLSPVPADLSKRAPSSPDGDPIGVSGHDDRPDQVFLRPDWHGDAPTGDVDVIDAEGVDLRPIDPITDALRLMAYCWADQDARLARLRAALALARAHPPRVAAGDAAGWLQDRLSRPAPGRLTLVYHTVAAQYFPQSTQAACEAALQGAAAAADATAPVAHFAMEADGGEGAALTLRIWDGHARGWHLGRGDFHGRWVRWNPVATEGLGEGRADRQPCDQHEEAPMEPSLNVMGGVLQPCSKDPVTGFYRNGCCDTGPEDAGSHTVCVIVTAEFLAMSAYLGNDLSTPRPEFRFPGLKPGDRWRLCAARFMQAAQELAAPKVVLEATHVAALDILPLELLRAHAVADPQG